MIEINLLPGAAGKRKAKSGGGRGSSAGAMFAGLGASVRDPYMISAAGSLVLAVLVVGGLYLMQERRDTELRAAEEVAVDDSSRFANFLKQRRRAQATRDTVLRQINVIRAIDGDRYLWPHVLEEVSKALPQYTWLTSLGNGGIPQGTSTPAIIGEPPLPPGAPPRPPAASAPASAPRAPGAPAAAAGLDTNVARDMVQIQLEGQTVDIEAITRFMRQLEASPFIGQVQLGKSQLSIIDGREVTTFSLQANYVRVDSGSVINRVPLRASVTSPVGN